MKELDGLSMDLEQKNLESMKQLFPEAFKEGKIDFEVLKQLLGEYVEEEDERYQFTWNGKSEALRNAQTPSSATLRPDRESSKNWDETENLYIEGDNLEVLKLLQKSYFEKIDVIYIDPPYNTGNDFVYEDNFRDSLKNYKEQTGQVEDGKAISTNPETSGRYHTDWLNMMYPRLKLARNLLSEDGAIFISIDDNEQSNLKNICDEIFGENNFIATFLWQKTYSPKNNNKFVSEDHDFILSYAKNKDSLGSLNRLPRTKEANSFYKHNDDDGKGFYGLADLTVGKQKGYDINWNDKIYKEPPTRGWVFSEKKMYELIKEGRIYLPKDNKKRPRYKRYLSEVDGIISKTILPYKNVGHSDGAKKQLDNLLGINIFDYPKPTLLIHYFLILASNKNSTVLDFFSGSATTAHATMQLNAEDGGNRKFIMVQLPEKTDEKSEAFKAGYKNIAEIGRERIRRAGDQIIYSDEYEYADNVDIGFKTFKLDSSNLKEWDTTLDNGFDDLFDHVSNVKEDRCELDLVYEVVLKAGLNLTYPIEELLVEGKKIYNVGYGALMICLDDEIDEGIARKMVELHNEEEPMTWRVVFKDNGFKNDSVKLNTKEILKTAGLSEDSFMSV